MYKLIRGGAQYAEQTKSCDVGTIPPKMASTGDDLTARVWTLKTPSSSASPSGGASSSFKDGIDAGEIAPEMSALFPLGSPGVALGWHPDDPAKLMVAEKAGVIRFYNVSNQQVRRGVGVVGNTNITHNIRLD